MQQYYGDEVRIIPKNAKKGRKNRVYRPLFSKKFVVSVIVLCVVALLFTCFYSPLPSDRARIFTRDWFFVKTHSEKEYEKIALESVNAKERGGSGYIINDGNFVLTVAVFDSETNAKKVADKTDGAKVFKVTLLGKVVDKNETLVKALNIHGEIYQNLHSVLSEYETHKNSEAFVLFVAQTWANETKKLQAQLIRENYPLVYDYLFKIKESLERQINDATFSVSSRIRYALCEIIYERAKLSKIL